MGVKLGSIVMMLMIFFIAKISFETATAETNPGEIAHANDRTAASIDQSYRELMSKR